MPQDYRTMFDRDYIGSFDLPEGKGDLTLTIKSVAAGDLTAAGGRKSKKPIIQFRENVKPLICNKTNSKTIAALYGNFVEDWAGKRITLYRSSTNNPDGGGSIDCIRVRPQAPKGNGADEPDDVITADQAVELEQLCREGGRDLTIDLLKFGAIETIEYLQAHRYKRAKEWIQKQRLQEHEGTQS